MQSQAVWYAAMLVLFAALMVDDAGAQTCGLTTCTGDEVCWEGDGTLAFGIECGYLEADFGWPVTQAGLDNWGGLSVGTPVHVEGCLLVAEAGICVMEGIIFHVRGNTIQALTEPVPSLATKGLVALALLALAIGVLGLRLQRRVR